MTDKDFEYITLRLPSWTVKWLRIVSKQFGMTESQLATYILDLFREFWKLGRIYEEEKSAPTVNYGGGGK